MLKISGALILFAASLLLGYRKYFAICERRHSIETALSSLKLMEDMLKCRCAPLYECFASGKGVFSDAAKLMEDGASPDDAIIRAAKAAPFLSEEDKTHFYVFAAGLSAHDCAGQIANTMLFESMLEKSYADARDDVARHGVLALRGSALLGAGAVILLL